MAFSQYLATQVLNWVRNTTFAAAPSSVFVSIHTGDPGTAGNSNDVTNLVTNAARVAISSAAFTTVGSASGGGFQITNTGTVQLTTNAQNPTVQRITHFGLWDAASSGNFLASGSLTTAVDVQSGDTVQFNVGALAVRVV